MSKNADKSGQAGVHDGPPLEAKAVVSRNHTAAAIFSGADIPKVDTKRWNFRPER